LEKYENKLSDSWYVYHSNNDEEKTKPIWKADKRLDCNISKNNKQEIEDLLDAANEFKEWLEPKMKKRNDFEIDFKKKWILKKCEKFEYENGTTVDELEEGYYLIKKDEYLSDYKKWCLKVKEFEKWKAAKNKEKTLKK
jgi:hypothetical protein